jgi:CubicO group peptidase (beta-lactamase class C family)
LSLKIGWENSHSSGIIRHSSVFIFSFIISIVNLFCNHFKNKTIAMSKKTTLALIAAFFFFSAIAQDLFIAKRLQALMPSYENLNQYTGTVVLAYKGKTLFQHSYGLADREKNTLNNSNSLYNIGSIGKMFTSVAILQLVEKGKLKLDEPIQKYLPEYNLPNADKITAIHLLTHTSGYNTYMRSKEFDNSRVYSLHELVKLIANQPLKFEKPGSGSAYSNSAFVILGRMIEKASGMSWWDYYTTNIFKPAGITNVHRLTPGQKVVNKAVGYSYNAAGVYENVTSDPMPYSDGGFMQPQLIYLSLLLRCNQENC